jgi:alpha-tubulin suppressor-like RCC1 family protein
MAFSVGGVKTMKQRHNCRHRWNAASLVGGAVLLISGTLALISCPMPFNTKLLDDVKQRVDEHNRPAQPDIMILHDKEEIPDGGSTDAFAEAVQGIELDTVFTIHNSGGADLHLRETDPLVFSGVDASLFSVLIPPGEMTVADGASTTFTIRFLLDSPGTKTAEIAVYSDDPDENPYAFTVSNTALPEIQVLQGTNEIPSGTGSYNFGTVEYGQQRDVVFTIKNLGKADLELTGTAPVSVTGAAFSVQSQPSSPIAPQESSDFTVRVQSFAPFAFAGAMSIANNDSNENPYTFDTSGICQLPRSKSKMAAGKEHTVALKNDGSIWTWGQNDYGQLGDGSTTGSMIPLDVSGISGVVSTAAGGYHTVALKSDGSIWAWGRNDQGQLGNGSTEDQLVPVKVPTLSGIAAIEVGLYHTVALKKDGTVYSWGHNYHGQLGDGTTTPRTVPVQISGLSEIIAIAAGSYHTVALIHDGTVWTWGDNRHGQLGDGTTHDRSTASQVSDLSGVSAIAAGLYHTIALKQDGTVWAWGLNSFGQLGDGTETNRLVPVQVSNLLGVSAIAAGYYHTLALKSDNTIQAWGHNYYGQLGDGTKTTQHVPVQVKGPNSIGWLSAVSAIAAGSYHNIALKSDGTIWCWGRNNYGKLGDGTIVWRCTPVQVVGLSGVAAITVGGYHSVGLKSEQTVWTWGLNGYGQLGDGTTIWRYSPVQAANILGATAIAAGGAHTLALQRDRTVSAWGSNNWGQLGDGTTTNRHTGVRVSGLSTIIAIAAGRDHTVVLNDDRTVLTWGRNDSGQLGDGTTSYRSTPVQVKGPAGVGWLEGVEAIAAGDAHTVILKSDGTVWAWGDNDYGQLGPATDTDQTSPVQVSSMSGPLSKITAIAGGKDHSLALKSDGTVWAWGRGRGGALGNGGTTDSAHAVQVVGLSEVISVAAGEFFSVSLKSDGTIWAWGSNEFGQLGDGTTTTQLIPVQVSNLSTVAAIAAGNYHSIAVKSDGTVWAWGLNSYGQLGDGTTVDRHTAVQVSDF